MERIFHINCALRTLNSKMVEFHGRCAYFLPDCKDFLNWWNGISRVSKRLLFLHTIVFKFDPLHRSSHET